MNAVTSFVAIVSLLLALATAGGAAKQQAEVNSPAAARDITPSKIVLNHNETMVSDAALVQQADTLSEWLTSLQAYVFTRFSTYVPGGGGCDDDWGCGMNDSETLARDAA